MSFRIGFWRSWQDAEVIVGFIGVAGISNPKQFMDLKS